MPSLQKYLRTEIDLRGWSMDEFARRAQLSLSNAYLIVRDGKDNVRQTTFDNIASALSMTPAELAVVIGKGAPSEDPQRVTIQALTREIPEEDLGTFERIAVMGNTSRPVLPTIEAAQRAAGVNPGRVVRQRRTRLRTT